MPDAMHLHFTSADQNYLFGLVRDAILGGLDNLEPPSAATLPLPGSSLLRKPLGAFVTLHERGSLRGCIGMMETTDPLYVTVASMAWAAAFQDRRFRPLSREELPLLDADISILGPMTPCPDTGRIEPGRHGLMLEARGRRSVFLPQVAVEQGWSVVETLKQLCRKAGLPSDAFRDADARILWYESVLLGPRHDLFA